MKFLHLSDLHLGKSLGEFDLIEDQNYILKQIIQIIDEHPVDGVLIAGDIYDKAIPSEAAVNLLNTFLNDLAERNVSVYIISGNHDSDDRLNFGSTLFASRRVYISSVYNGELFHQVLEDDFGKLHIYLLPFVKASYVRHFYPEEPIDTYEDAIRVILRHADINWEERNVIAAHQFVAGRTGDPRFGGSEGTAVQNVGLVERVGADCFDGFEYVALGHIHAPQQIGREEVRYSGSPLKYSLSEAANNKSVPLITCMEKGNVQIELIPLQPYRDVRHLKGTMAQLTDPGYLQSPEDYMYITLTEEDLVDNAMGIFQQIYPNTVRIDYENSHTRELESSDIRILEQTQSYAELIRDFYQFIYNCEISEEEMKIMNQAAQEAGIINETDQIDH